jgi:ABC-type phosphate/phosphonate transport system permease subunit
VIRWFVLAMAVAGVLLATVLAVFLVLAAGH